MEVKKVTGFRTLTGQDIITQTDEEGNWLYPLQVALVPQQNGGAGVHIGPLIPYAKNQKLKPNQNSIFFSFEVDDKLAEQYQTAYTRMRSAETGLHLPDKPSSKIIL